METTIVSYLTARRSRNLIVRAHQEITRPWWRKRSEFDVYASPLVVEAGRGDVRARIRRHRFLRELSLLEITDESRTVARRLLDRGPLAAQAEGDALHIGIAVAHGMEYLATWNCRHVANAWMRPQIEEIIRDLGYEPPVFCTPEELGGVNNARSNCRRGAARARHTRPNLTTTSTGLLTI